MRTTLPALLLLLSCLLATASHAHETETWYDRVSLSADASESVANDTIIATLYAEEQGSDATRLANMVNSSINAAIKRIKPYRDIKLETQSYTTSPLYHKNKVSGWRVRQSLSIESRNMALVSELLGELQQNLKLQSISFSVSPERQRQVDDALISEALAAFEARARLVVNKLKRRGYRIVDINISTSGGVQPIRPYARAAMMQAEAAAPAMEAGESSMRVTVNGTIELE